MNEPSTNDVLKTLENVKTASEGLNYINENVKSTPDMTFKAFFDKFLADHPEKSISKIATDARLSRTYGYEIINGSKKGSRDKIIALCFSAGMNLNEANHALTYSGNSQLYAKNSRDAVIILAFNQRKTYNSVMKLNDLLVENGFDELKTSGD